MNKEVIIGLRIREAERANVRGKGGEQVKCLKPVLSEGSPPSNNPKKALNLRRDNENQIGLKGKVEDRKVRKRKVWQRNRKPRKSARWTRTKI